MRRASFALTFALLSAAGGNSSASSSAAGPQNPPQRSVTVRPSQTPERRAFDEAMQQRDPDAKLAALRAFLKEHPKSSFGRSASMEIVLLLATKPDRPSEIEQAISQVFASVPETASPETKLMAANTLALRLLDRTLLLDRAAGLLEAALGAFDREQFLAYHRERAKRFNDAQALDEDTIASRYESLRATALETLGRLHVEREDAASAERVLTEALSLNPGLSRGSLALARLEARRGNDAAALEHYMLAALGGRMDAADDKAFRALFRKVHGSDAGFEAALDEAYRTKLPNPIAVTPYAPTPARTSRVVLAELFTGSGCGPCASADLAFEGVLARYPRDVVAALAYHVHIPAPDPMTVPGSVARKEYYGVRGVPTMIVDGTWTKLGGGSRINAERSYADYVQEIDRRLQQQAFGAVELRAAVANGTVSVHVDVSRLPAGAKGLRLHVVLAERDLRFGGENGIRFHPMTVRAVAGDGAGIPIEGSTASSTQTFDLAMIAGDVETSLTGELARRQKQTGTGRAYRAEGNAMTTIDPLALVVVAFVQDGDKRVLQAATADVVQGSAARR
jgi:tetratricopeptide (TPR) repeat protein